MDSFANTAEDLLIDAFQFKIQPGASYVTDRRTVSYFTSGSNIYQSGSCAKLIRINITGDGWLDPGSIRLHYTLFNNNTTSTVFKRTLGGTGTFFSSIESFCGGCLIDDIDYYNRALEMMHVLSSNANRENDDTEGFSYRWDHRDEYGAWMEDKVRGIPGNNQATTHHARSVCFKPLCGLLTK